MSKIQLKNVRLSFPSVFRRETFDGNEGKFAATLLIPKDDKKQLDKLNALIDAAVKESGIKVPKDKYCLKDGDDIEYAGYEGMWSFKGSSNTRPTVIDRDKSPIAEDDNVIYAGCYVNAVVGVWVQNNQYGKRVNGNLYGIQFVKDGEAFGSGNMDVTDEFDDIEDEL